LVLISKISLGEAILKYEYKMDSKYKSDGLDGNLLKKYIVKKKRH